MTSSSCVLCGCATSQSISLCDLCQKDLPRIGHTCVKCGVSIDCSNSDICGQCLKAPPLVDYTFCLYHYKSPVDYLITQLKFHQQLSSAAILGYLFKESVLGMKQDDLPEVIVPVPLHKKRLIKRGFNQSLEIFRRVSKELNIPIDSQMIQRIKATTAQTDLNALQRKKNIKGSFKLNKITAYQHVVIADDVVTTGATVNELASELKKAGIKKVGVWAIARA